MRDLFSQRNFKQLRLTVKKCKKTKTKPISVRLGLQIRNLHFHVNMYLGHKFLKLFFFKQTHKLMLELQVFEQNQRKDFQLQVVLELEATRRHKIQIILS